MAADVAGYGNGPESGPRQSGLEDALMNAPALAGRRRRAKAVYPGKVAIRHAREAAESMGIDPGGLEIRPDGTIRIFDRAAISTASPKDEFEEWLQAGKLG
jgi:hypothetical protein